MKKFIQLYSTFLLIVLFAFCKGPISSDQQKDNKNQKESGFIDPYSSVVDSNATTTPYGPTRITRCIRQDGKGNLLLATYQGIIKYDGNAFTNFTTKEGLIKCEAFDVLEDRAGNLWIASDHHGAYFYDGKNFTHFTTKNGLPHNRTFKIYEDKTDNIWISSMGGVSRYNGKTFTNFTTKDGLDHNDVTAILEDKTGKFWISTRGKASFFDGKNFTTIIDKEGATFNNIHGIIEDQKGNIWLGGSEGLWRYDGGSFSKISSVKVSDIYEDKTGNIWVTHAGNSHNKYVLSRYDAASLLNDKPSPTQIFMDDGMFFGISEDKEGSIWVGTLQGVFRYDGDSFNYFRDPDVM